MGPGVLSTVRICQKVSLPVLPLPIILTAHKKSKTETFELSDADSTNVEHLPLPHPRPPARVHACSRSHLLGEAVDGVHQKFGEEGHQESDHAQTKDGGGHFQVRFILARVHEQMRVGLELCVVVR